MLTTLALLLAIATSESPTRACHLAEQVHLLNIPIGSTQHSTEIVHAATVTNGAGLLGYLYFVRNGQVWYHNGLLGSGGSLYVTRAPSADAQRARELISPASKDSRATLYRIRNGNVERRLWSAGYSINACY